MKVIIDQIKVKSFTDGPGEKVVVFFRGCSIRCPGCQNPGLWGNDGHIVDVPELASTLKFLSVRHGNITISGGEPFDQPRALAELVTLLRKMDILGLMNIQVYSGYTWEELTDPMHPAYPYAKEIFERIDVLVDGPFKFKLDNPFLVYRGSANQRPIDVQATLETGQVTVLDWDNPQIQIDPSGNIYMPVGLVPELSGLGEVQNTRRCGEAKKS